MSISSTEPMNCFVTIMRSLPCAIVKGLCGPWLSSKQTMRSLQLHSWQLRIKKWSASSFAPRIKTFRNVSEGLESYNRIEGND
jgi:hypothetical protein